MYNAVEQNLRASMRCYSNVGESAEARDYPAVTVASTGLDIAVFNSAMLRDTTSTLDRAIAQADVHFRARRLGWTFWVCEDLLAAGDRRQCAACSVSMACHGSRVHPACSRRKSFLRRALLLPDISQVAMIARAWSSRISPRLYFRFHSLVPRRIYGSRNFGVRLAWLDRILRRRPVSS